MAGLEEAKEKLKKLVDESQQMVCMRKHGSSCEEIHIGHEELASDLRTKLEEEIAKVKDI